MKKIRPARIVFWLVGLIKQKIPFAGLRRYLSLARKIGSSKREPLITTDITRKLVETFPPAPIDLEWALSEIYLTQRYLDEYDFAQGLRWDQLTAGNLRHLSHLMPGLNNIGFRLIIPAMINLLQDFEAADDLINTVPAYLIRVHQGAVPYAASERILLTAQEIDVLTSTLHHLPWRKWPLDEDQVAMFEELSQYFRLSSASAKDWLSGTLQYEF